MYSKKQSLSLSHIFPSTHHSNVQNLSRRGQRVQEASGPMPPLGALMEQAFTVHLSHQSLYAWLQPPLTCKSSTGLRFAPRHVEPSVTGNCVSEADYCRACVSNHHNV